VRLVKHQRKKSYTHITFICPENSNFSNLEKNILHYTHNSLQIIFADCSLKFRIKAISQKTLLKIDSNVYMMSSYFDLRENPIEMKPGQ